MDDRPVETREFADAPKRFFVALLRLRQKANDASNRFPFSGIDQRIVEREEAEYEAADVIAVPSTFVLKTFVNEGMALEKLRLSPYGVDLNRFYPCAQKNEREFRILFVGGITVRKGVNYLLEAFRQLRFEKNISPWSLLSPRNSKT
jgi:glycosyltransferase involved in cell wall biosynthesis